jgi:hypothetical protein
MSYDPSHRRPPRQERWPNATPGEGWPAYQQGDGERSRAPADALAGGGNGYGTASNSSGTSSDGSGTSSDGYGPPWGGRATTAGDTWHGRAPARYNEPASGYQSGANGYSPDGYGANGYDTGYGANGYDAGYGANGYSAGYGQTQEYYRDGDGWDDYAPGHEFSGPADYQEQEKYSALEPGVSSVLVAPDMLEEWWRQPEAGAGRGLGRGPVVGAVTGILAAAVAIGVATFAAAFVGPQASPTAVLGTIFVDRIPAALKNSVMAHFGAHDRTVLLLGMYAAIGVIAMVLGCMARRSPSAGVAGIAAFGLLVAFIVVTRPQSRAGDVIPSAIGAVAGAMALLLLARASAPVATAALRPAYGGGRRRAR